MLKKTFQVEGSSETVEFAQNNCRLENWKNKYVNKYLLT